MGPLFLYYWALRARGQRFRHYSVRSSGDGVPAYWSKKFPSRLPLSIVSQKSGFISSGHEMPADRSRNGNGVHEEEPNRRRRWYTKQLLMRLLQSISHHVIEELDNDSSYIITIESGEDVAYFYTESVREENPPSTPENSVEQDQVEEVVGVSSTTEDSDECPYWKQLAAIVEKFSKPYEYQEEDSDEMLQNYEDGILLSNDELLTSTVQETYPLTEDEIYLSDDESITSTIQETYSSTENKFYVSDEEAVTSTVEEPFSSTYGLSGFTNQNNFSAVFIDQLIVVEVNPPLMQRVEYYESVLNEPSLPEEPTSPSSPEEITID
ncbi:hypothetical protein M0802_014142 [Mischocyttarus mexicanus]|nr:hypothetical protein M0802_014142 [Mischocyttarus mexicanus]